MIEQYENYKFDFRKEKRLKGYHCKTDIPFKNLFLLRDAWGYGAMDPSSGTAAVMEVVRVMGSLFKTGWRPRRTIGRGTACSETDFELIKLMKKLKVIQS